MMSGHELIDMLKRIGYPQATNLDSHSIDWAFKEQSTLPFMQWLCSIGKDNVLSKEEIDEYEELQKTGKVLSGSHLEEALKAASCSQDKEDASGLQYDIEQLEQDVHHIQEKKALLLKEKSQLDIKQITLKSKLSKMEDIASQVKRTSEDSLDSLSSHSSKIDDILKKLNVAVRGITELYKGDVDQVIKSGTRKGAGNPVFLSQTKLSNYHQAEEKFSQDLTAFTKKRFFEGIADIAGQVETSQYSILDISSHGNVSVDGSEDEDFLEDCQEFTLLQKIFPQSEINRLNALVNAQKAVYAVQEAKNILHLLKTDQFPTSISRISNLQSKTEDSIHQTEEEVSQYTTIVPDLVKQLGPLQGNEILTGDYDLKLRRQDYFTKNQDRIIEYLWKQRSRSEFLLMFYEIELKFHEKTHHLLSAAEKSLKKHLQDWRRRMETLDDFDLSSAKFERNVVDARDVSCNRIYQMMAKLSSNPETEDQHLYLPLDKVIDRAVSLHSAYESAQDSQSVEDQTLSQNMSDLEDCVKQYDTALYAGCSTSAGLPNLTPTEVQASMVSLQTLLSSLSSDVEQVKTDITNKKKELKRNPMMCKERELFTLFHTKPDRLVALINGLEKKLKIQTMNLHDQ